ncbi:MAG: hypothetical protein ACPGJI_01910 [Kangiellaceae bacterium]
MMKKKPSLKTGAYSLIEFIITLLILSIVAIYIQSKFSSSDPYKQNTTVAQLISTARLAQQFSMNDSARAFVLKIQANQIDLTEDGSSMSIGTLNFPIALESGVTLSPITDITFNSLGETTSVTIQVSANTAQSVCFESSGYIHKC